MKGLGLRVEGAECRVWGEPLGQSPSDLSSHFLPLRVSGSQFQVSGFGFGFRDSISNFELQISGFRFQVSGFDFRASGFGFRVSNFGFRWPAALLGGSLFSSSSFSSLS